MFKALAVVFVLFSVLSLGSCYITVQGYHYLRDQARAKPVAPPSRFTPRDGENELFSRTADIRRYATAQLGLKETANYTTYVRTEKEYLVHVVSAVADTSFDRYEWWFPVTGSVPYKGFYRRAAAERLVRRLKRKQQDVVMRPVEAFSTLGFFRDPLYTFMIDYPDARLAELMIHEMAHATVWVKGDSQFNEEFATFVGRAGARRYLVSRHGADSEVVRSFDRQQDERAELRKRIRSVRAELATLYARDLARDVMLAEKERIIAAGDFPFPVNNAVIDLYGTYEADLSLFADALDSAGGDFPRFVALVRDAATHGKHAKEALRAVVADRAG